MSLHDSASQVQSAGRGEDKVLVHMTPKEVGGLQSLAMAHGGSLTINPETGLPEAGFLSSILPMAIGFGLAPLTGGLSAALITGGGYAAATGSLKKGIMAGLGAYGGAGLASGLSSMGATAGSNAANAAANSQINNLYGGANAATPAVTAAAPAPITFKNIGTGFKDLANPEGFSRLYDAMPKNSIMAGLGGTAANYYDEQREEALEKMKEQAKNQNQGMIRPYEFAYNPTNTASEPYFGSAERTYFQPTYTAGTPYKAPGPEYAAAGGLTSLAVGGPVEQMAAMNSVGANTGYPMANLQTPMYSNPAMQRPEATNVIAPSADAGVNAYTGEARFAGGGETQYGRPVLGANSGHVNPENQTRAELAGGRRPSSTAPTAPLPEYLYDPKTQQFTQVGANGAVTGGIAQPAMQSVRQPTNPAQPLIPSVNIPAYQTPEQQLGLGGFYDYMNQQMGGYAGYAAGGGVSHLGDYSDGGRLLKGPGDGVSDSIPASIGSRQPARLADGEFVVPARIVSEIGNGSTEAGARKLYAMMDRVQRARKKTTGKNQVAANTKAEKLLPV